MGNSVEMEIFWYTTLIKWVPESFLPRIYSAISRVFVFLSFKFCGYGRRWSMIPFSILFFFCFTNVVRIEWSLLLFKLICHLIFIAREKIMTTPRKEKKREARREEKAEMAADLNKVKIHFLHILVSTMLWSTLILTNTFTEYWERVAWTA